MKRTRVLLLTTALLSSLVGGTIVYLAISVPNDLRADALLGSARKDLEAGRNSEALASLSKVVQQYPRTDAAGAATIALVSLASKDRDALTRSIAHLRKSHESQSTVISDLRKRVVQLEKPPPPPPPAPVVKAPVKPVVKKPVVKKKAPVRRRR